MPKKIKKELTVNVLFEPSRIKEIHLKEAYEVLLPAIKTNINKSKFNCKLLLGVAS